MATRAPRRIIDRLHAAEVIFAHSLHEPAIREAVASRGYTLAELRAGRALLEAACAAHEARVMHAGNQRSTSAAVQQATGAARRTYLELAQLARTACDGDEERLTRLDLTGPMPDFRAGFLSAAYRLVDGVRSDSALLDQLAAAGYSPQQLAADRATIVALDVANQAFLTAKGKAQRATHAQYLALAALERWLTRYLRVARAVLRDDAHALAQLGIRPRQTPPLLLSASESQSAQAS